MKPEDLELCRAAVKKFTSKECASINYLFLEPVNTQLFPTYLDVIKHPMDLGTLKNNLEAGKYATREAFFADAMLCFENALTFHHGRKETQHVIKVAKEMMRVVAREKRNAERKASGGKKGGKGRKGASAKGSGLKIKLSTGKKAAADSAKTTAASKSTGKPKAPSLKLRTTGASTDASASNKEAKPKKPRLKLSLSKKSSAPAAAPAPAPAPANAAPPVPAPATQTQSQPPKIQLKAPAGPRGKELPKGVTPQPAKKSTKKAESKKAGDSKGTKAKKPIVPTVLMPPPAAPPPRTVPIMTPERKIRCMKVLSGLKRRKFNDVVWFLQPVSDKAIVDDYQAKIKLPMDLGTMASKLEKNEYKIVPEFVLDMRRVFGNCLRYNTTIRDSFRPLAVDMLGAAEELMAYFIAKPEGTNPLYPPLLYCWQLCVNILDSLLNVSNPEDVLQTCHYFLHPVSFYCGGTFPPDYLAKVKRPMDFGTVTSLLAEGHYQDIHSFASDCRLIITNCLTYYSNREDGALIVDQAKRLNALMSQQLDALVRYDQSPSGAQARANAISPATVRLVKPPESLLLGMLQELRESKYTDRYTMITEPAMGPFEKPVDIAHFRDYLQFVKTPMDLQQVERRIRSGAYLTPEDFEYDVALIFRNCEAYNAPKKNDHLVAMGKFGAKTFRKLFSARMKAYEHPELQQPPKEPDRKRSASPSSSQSESKRIRIDTSAVPGGKSAPRISITASKMPPSGSTKTMERSKSPKAGGTLRRRTSDVSKSNEPVPLHVAIAQVKERFPLRRPYKLLESWESACARFFRELMRQPWISAARPKFIFHVPVPVLFPQLKDAYAAKIAKPMDLTTVEAKLLQGGLYSGAQDFVDEVSLVFANAIRFNKAGRDEGDPLSCAYYDASVHLLRYTRWLSLELLVDYLTDDPHPDMIEPDGLPPFHWKLSKENRKKAREEMEAIVLNEPIEKSLEGDRYTWMEAECEKLLKALRHQSDLKYMTFFIQPNYPADYAAFISKPMDWERCQRKLARRQYDTFRDIIDDLRLIFSNALRYNARAKGTDTVSGRAYDAAIYMSGKLETAIDRLMLSISEKVERERIDHTNAEREIAAAQRAEEERMREAMKKDPSQAAAAASAKARVETIETVRIINRRVPQRRDMMNFEVPFFDEEEGRHEQSHIDAMRIQKATFEAQRGQLAQMRKIAAATGAALFAKLAQREQAIQWAERIAEASRVASSTEVRRDAGGSNASTTNDASTASSVLAALNQEGRAQIKFAPKISKKKTKKKSKPLPSLDFE